MMYKNIIIISIILSITSCKHEPVSIENGGYYYNNIYFGKDLDKPTQKGIIDGCKTAKGTYNKNHTLFQNNNNYQEAWFIGRNRCNNT